MARRRRVVWTKSARRDVEEIRTQLRTVSPEYAKVFVRRLKQAVDGFTLFPEAGSLLPEYEESGRREVFVDSHRLIYFVTDDEISIEAVIHGARNLRRAWRPDHN